MKRKLKPQSRRPLGKAVPMLAILLCLFVFFVSSRGSSMYERLLSLRMPALFAPQENTQGGAEPQVPQPQITSTIDIDKNDKESIRVELLHTATADSIDLSGSEPRILIYHTHATEAYTPTSKHQYEASEEWRTHDNTRNVVAVGDRLAELLTETYGIQVLHDTTNYEPPKLATSYSRSLEGMEKYKAIPRLPCLSTCTGTLLAPARMAGTTMSP